MPLARRVLILAAISAAVVPSGCATFERTRPHDMSVLEHRRAARSADERSRYEAAEADKGGRVALQHRATARHEAELAAAHADAANQLLAVERAACEDIPAHDIAPGLSGLEVIRVSTLDRRVKFREVPEGVAFVVGTRGRPFDALARLMRCRVAHAAVTRDASDPLSLTGTYVRTYRDDGDAAIVQIVSRDPDRAEEIIRRVRRSGVGGGLTDEDGRSFDPGDAGSDRSRPRVTDDPGSPGSSPSRPGPPGGFDPIGGTHPGGR